MAVDVYQRITAQILRQLEQGTVPWHRPWRGGEAGHPRNLASGHHYRGVNVFLLTCSGFESPFWLTYRQAQTLGGYVRKGETSTPVVFWKWLQREDPQTGEAERHPLLRHYNVFNSEQCDLPDGKAPEVSEALPVDFEPIAVCERVVREMPDPPVIHHVGGAAFYRPATDSIHLPQPERFNSPAEYYSTLFHELSHATGHESRLNRSGVTAETRFGSPVYSKEELIAEMGATFLCGHCGIETGVIDNSAAYIAGWLRSLHDDKRLVVHAAAAAQKATDFVLGRKFDSETEDHHE